MESEVLRFALFLRFERFVDGVNLLAASDGVDRNSGVSSPVVSSLSSPVVNSLSSSVVNSSSTAVADALLLDAGKACEGVAATVAALYTFAEEPKCEVSTALNKWSLRHYALPFSFVSSALLIVWMN